ncbi:MAG: hypothetical protein MZV63_06415 [Marinilabiliales bacterium]|nr:hypothetical protein [Marinilabiliales bacterium]
MAAIHNGISVDTTMGFTPLEGLVMGTRCGDIDPAIPLFIAAHDGHEPSSRYQRHAQPQERHPAGSPRISSDMRDIDEKAAAGQRPGQAGPGDVRLPHQEIHRGLAPQPWEEWISL